MQSRRMMLVLVSLALAGCASHNPQQEPVVQGPGPQPTPEVAERAVRAYLGRALKDPDSLKQFAVTSQPACVKWYRGAFGTGGMAAGWAVGVEYNAKNSYGAYTGLARERVILRGHSPDTMEPVGLPTPEWYVFPC